MLSWRRAEIRNGRDVWNGWIWDWGLGIYLHCEFHVYIYKVCVYVPICEHTLHDEGELFRRYSIVFLKFHILDQYYVVKLPYFDMACC